MWLLLCQINRGPCSKDVAFIHKPRGRNPPADPWPVTHSTSSQRLAAALVSSHDDGFTGHDSKVNRSCWISFVCCFFFFFLSSASKGMLFTTPPPPVQRHSPQSSSNVSALVDAGRLKRVLKGLTSQIWRTQKRFHVITSAIKTCTHLNTESTLRFPAQSWLNTDYILSTRLHTRYRDQTDTSRLFWVQSLFSRTIRVKLKKNKCTNSSAWKEKAKHGCRVS